MKPPFTIRQAINPGLGEEEDWALIDADGTIVGEFWHLCPSETKDRPVHENAYATALHVCQLLNKHYDEEKP